MATEAHDTTTQPLPTPGAGARLMLHTPLHSIAPSLTNPRKQFDAAKLQELADSIKASGVHQPVLLRPLPPHRLEDTHREARANKRPAPEFELIAGERRWRACQLAGLAEIPAMVRPMSDTEALEAQVIENLQREDVTELEEAEGYEVLMRTGNLNADQVAAKIGKSRSYVYARLKVMDLCSQAREALREGKIDFSRGLLIARIPDESLQIKALDFCTGINRGFQSDPPGYRECARYVQQNYMLKLSSAKFKITDATLVPKSGSCKECPKRTGANPDLFQDVDSADVCTDPKCYHAKEDAHAIAVKKAALDSGAHIIEGREAKTLMPSAYTNEVSGYLRLDDKADSPTDKPLRKIIGKAMEQQGVQPTLVANPHKNGELIAVLTTHQVEALLKAADQEEAAAKVARDMQLEDEADKRQAEADAKTIYEAQWRWDLLATTWKTICSEGLSGAPLGDAATRFMAKTMVKTLNQDRAKKLCKLLDLGKVAPQDGLLQHIAETNEPADMLQLLMMFNDVEYRSWLSNSDANEGLLLIAEQYSVDVGAVKAKTKANQRAAAAKKAERLQADAPAGTSTPPPAAHASATREEAKGQKSKGKNGPAAQARATAPKTTKADAAAQIAAALAAADGDQNQAPAAHGNEGAPAPSGGVAVTAAPSTTASAHAPSVARAKGKTVSTSPATDSAAAPGGDATADASTGAAGKEGGDFKPGMQVRVSAKATAPKHAPFIGKTGVLRYLVGVKRDAWRVAFPEIIKRGDAVVESFNVELLESVDA